MRTLADYRPQHDEDCRCHHCAECGYRTHGDGYSASARRPPHNFRSESCTCGLDALLAPSPAPPERHEFKCQTCGPCAVDEDGCCVTCGADTDYGGPASAPVSPAPDGTTRPTRERIIRAVGAADCCEQDSAYFVAANELGLIAKERLEQKYQDTATAFGERRRGFRSAINSIDLLLADLSAPSEDGKVKP